MKHNADVENWIRTLDNAIKPTAIQFYEAIVRSDRYGEISHQAEIVSRSLKTFSSLSKQQLYRIGQAHTLAWLSYSLYDKLHDDTFTSNDLTLANTSHRQSLVWYLSLNISTSKVTAAFNHVDQANTWEVQNLRMSVDDNSIDYAHSHERKAYIPHIRTRVSGHLLPAQLVLCSLRLSEQSYNSAMMLFSDYAVARQLSDNLCDWEDDLRTGKETYVVHYILKSILVTDGRYSLDHVITKARKFLHEQGGAVIIARTILRYYESARNGLSIHPLFHAHSSFSETILVPHIKRLKEAINIYEERQPHAATLVR